MRVDQLIEYRRELQARLEELEDLLKRWSPRGGEQSFTWYKRYIQSDHILLPYPGGQANQPVWWWDDVEIMEVIGGQYWLPTELKRVAEQLQSRAKRKP